MSEPPFRDVPKPHLATIEFFIARARAARTKGELRVLLEDVCRELGFRYFALIEHADLADTHRGVIRIDNYPACWAEHFIANKLYRVDPVLRATRFTHLGFLWSELSSLIRMTPTDNAMLDAGRREGLESGFTIPIHVPGERPGSCTFATRTGASMPGAEVRLVAQLVGAFAFEAARRLIRSKETKREIQARVRLTPRERQCVMLAACGKTDWEMSRILSISHATTQTYMHRIRARYDVARRTQAVVQALFDSEISFNDVLGR